MSAPKKEQKPKAPVFETLAIQDDTQVDPETGAVNPPEHRVVDAKNWVDENEL